MPCRSRVVLSTAVAVLGLLAMAWRSPLQKVLSSHTSHNFEVFLPFVGPLTTTAVANSQHAASVWRTDEAGMTTSAPSMSTAAQFVSSKASTVCSKPASGKDYLQDNGMQISRSAFTAFEVDEGLERGVAMHVQKNVSQEGLYPQST